MNSLQYPMLRYFGGKWKIAPWIISHFPEHYIYIEPFGGGASVLLRKKRSSSEIYNDLDGNIVNVFRVMRNNGEQLRELLRLTPYAREEYYLSLELTDDPIELARRTIVRSFMGFGSDSSTRMTRSGFRAKRSGNLSTPAQNWANRHDSLSAITERLRNVTVENRDAMEVMTIYDDKTALHYVDPPYVQSSRSSRPCGRHGYNHDMTDEQHVELIKFLKTLKGFVVVSSYDHEIYCDGLTGWQVEKKQTLADGTHCSKGNQKRTELLWLSPNIKTQQCLDFKARA